MAQMNKALKILFSGDKVIEKQICLFAVCGIGGLIISYFVLFLEDYLELTPLLFGVLGACFYLFYLFITSIEIEFLHKRELPNIGINNLKIMFTKTPLLVSLVCIPILILAYYFKHVYTATVIELLLSIPLTMIIAAYSYNLQNKDNFIIFHKFKVKDYFFLLLKKIFVVILTHFATFVTLSCICFATFLIILGINKLDFVLVSNMFAGTYTMLSKLTIFINTILFTYISTNLSLVWDYELLKTYEGDK